MTGRRVAEERDRALFRLRGAVAANESLGDAAIAYAVSYFGSFELIGIGGAIGGSGNVEAPGARALLAEPEPGPFESRLDHVHAVELELGEAEVVGRARVDQRLRQHSVFGLHRGELSHVARKRRTSSGGKRSHANQIGVREQRLARHEGIADRRQAQSVARAAEDDVGDPELLRLRAEVVADEAPVIELCGVRAVEYGGDARGNFGAKRHSPEQLGQERDGQRLGRGREPAELLRSADPKAEVRAIGERIGCRGAQAADRESGGADTRALQQLAACIKGRFRSGDPTQPPKRVPAGGRIPSWRVRSR
jgi:hypothetical protein